MGASAKKVLRRELKAARAALGAAERAHADRAILAALGGLPHVLEAPRVYTYRSFGAEVDTSRLITWCLDAGKRVALPRCVPGSRALEWYAVDGLEGLVPGPFGIEEPAPDPARRVDGRGRAGDVAIVPGLAFDRAGFRLGYGGGYYDAFLDSFAGHSIGVCRAAELVESLAALGAVEAHDVPVRQVVCG